MGSKGDIDIGGTGGGEPRDDYAPMSSVLSTDFPVFDDGAGEIEEIPGGLPSDGTLYYFQSSYVFNTFPGTDGFFGFSNDSTYPFEGRKDTYVEVVASGDWFVDYATNRIYSYLDNLADSYVHMCEQDITYIGGGVYSYHYGSTITFIEFDGTGLGISGVLGAWNSDEGVAWLSNNDILMTARLYKGAAVYDDRLVRSHDRGLTWQLTGGAGWGRTAGLGKIVAPKGNPQRVYFPQFNVSTGYYWTSDLINFNGPIEAVGRAGVAWAPTWDNPPSNGDWAELFTSGSSSNRTFSIYEWDTGGDGGAPVKSMPPSWHHDGDDINDIDTLQFEVIDVGWFDAYVMASYCDGPSSHNWVNTTWKAQLYYWIPAAFDDGVGWRASDDPDFSKFEDIVVFSEIEGGGVVMIARFNENGSYSGSWPPSAIEPKEYFYKLYVSQDLGQSYTHVATLDKFPDDSLIDRAYRGRPNQGANRNRYKHSNVVKFTDSVTGSEGYVVHGLQNHGSVFPTDEIPVWFFSIDGQWRFLENQIDYLDWSNPSQPDRFSFRAPQKTDTTGQQYENGTYPGAYFIEQPLPNGINSHGGQLTILTARGTTGSGTFIRVMEYDAASFEYYTADLIVASSAGFTIRAPHINELRQKLLHLNANVQTGGTNRVNFGIDVSDLPTVQADKTPVRRDHYYICKRETDKVIGQVGTTPGGAYYSETDLTEFSLLMPDPIVDEEVSIRTLIGMRKTLQALYSDGWFCACYSYCPCQTFIDIEISGGKK